MALVEMGAVCVAALFATSVATPDGVLKSARLERYAAMAGMALPDSGTLLLSLGCATAGLVILKNLLSSLHVYLSSRFSALVDAHFGILLLEGFLNRRYEWHLGMNSADLVTTIEWRRSIGDSTIYLGLQTASSSLVVLTLLAAFFVVAPGVTLSSLVLVGLVALVVIKVFRPFQERIARRSMELNMTINRGGATALHGIKDVKVCGKEREFMRDFREDVVALADVDASYRVLLRTPGALLEIMGFSLLAGCVVVLSKVFGQTPAQITGVIAFFAIASWRILPAVSVILGCISTIRQHLPRANMLLEYIDQAETERRTLASAEDKADELAFVSGVEVRNVGFQYETGGGRALKDVSFDIPKNSSVGIIGRSGSGKSTLVDILIGLLPPESGAVCVDGRPLAPDTVRSWMNKIGYVGQTPYICDGTLWENIAFGLTGDEIDRDKVLECCRAAAIDEFLASLPQGLDTSIGERGVRLSGGQRQRVAIARALYRNPELLILDEATSALDKKSEVAIQETIDVLSKRLTMVIVAHRLSTVERCDTLVWLERGRVRAVGAAAEVLACYRKEIS